MHVFKAVLSLGALLAVQVGAKATFPPLFYLGTLNISITAGQMIPTYEGTRVLNSYLGGAVVDPLGKTIATIIPGEGGEGGLINSHGIFHPSVRGALQFVDPPDEIAYGYFTTQGIKNGTEFLYVTVETNSTKYDSLNRMFIIANVTKTPDSVLHFDLFTPGPALPL